MNRTIKKSGYIVISFLALMILSTVLITCKDSSDKAAGAGKPDHLAEAYFAGGCFWCVESDFERLPGVAEVVSGYSGGQGGNPTYEDYGAAGHIEAVKVIYDPAQVSYNELLVHFWTHIDPLDGGGQFCDRGHPYISAVFYRDQREKKLAENSMKRVAGILGREVKTVLLQYERFWKAEDYHQDYYKKNPIRYNYYRHGCGRDRRVREVWKGKRLGVEG